MLTSKELFMICPHRKASDLTLDVLDISIEAIGSKLNLIVKRKAPPKSLSNFPDYASTKYERKEKERRKGNYHNTQHVAFQ
jgi:hypothetical protein